MIKTSFESYFSMIQDLGQEGKILHMLSNILFIDVAAFMDGADNQEIVILFA